MDFSKKSIVEKHFSKKWMGGLSEFEVRDFLHVLAEEIRHLSQKNLQLEKKIQEQESLLRDYQDREHILKESIQSAEKWAEKIRKSAEQNSSLVLEKAQHKSETLIQEARHSLQTVYNDILDLKRIQLQFKTGLKAALQVQMDLLEQEPVFSSDSLLNSKSMERALEPSSPEQNVGQKDINSPLKTDKPLVATTEESQTFENPMDKLKIKDSELSSLKESLKSLDKSFS